MDIFANFIPLAKQQRQTEEAESYATQAQLAQGDIQTPGLTQQPQASEQGEHAGPALKSKPAPAQTAQAKPRGTREVAPAGVVGSAEHEAAIAEQGRQASLEQSMAENNAKDIYSDGREWLRPSDNPLDALNFAGELASMPGKAAVVKATGRDVGDLSRLDFQHFLDKINFPTPDKLNPDAPFGKMAMGMSLAGSLGLGMALDPTNAIPFGGPAKGIQNTGKVIRQAKDIAKNLKKGKDWPGQKGHMGSFSKQIEKEKISEAMAARSDRMRAESSAPPSPHTEAPPPSKGLEPESIAAEAHAGFVANNGEGVTYNPSSGLVDSGYGVAIGKEFEHTIEGTATLEDFRKYVALHSDFLAQHPDLSVGAWKDGDKTILDITASIDDYDKARKFGYMTGQREIWDFSKKQSLPLERMGLTHYGTPGRELEGGEIRPSTMFSGQGGGEKKRAMNYGEDFVERSFFYKKGTKPEDRFKGHPKYTVEVDPSRIYNMSEDPLGFNQSIRDYTLREKAIKERGYLGYTDPAGWAEDATMRRVVQLFENVRPKEFGLVDLDRRLAFLEETTPKFAPKLAPREIPQPDTTAGVTKAGHPYERPSDFTDDDDIMARVYDEAPTYDPNAEQAWRELAEEVDKHYNDIIKKVKVEKVTGQPYATAEEMNKDIASGHFKVTTDHGEHPLWGPQDPNDTNWKFRVVHDYIAHFEGKNDFSLEGEKQAYKYHAAILDAAPDRERAERMKKALMVEVYGQAAAALAHGGEFQTQKIFLPDFDAYAAKTGRMFGGVGVEYPNIKGPRWKGVMNNVMGKVGAAVLHRGAGDLASFQAGMEATGVVHTAGAEVNWQKFYDKAKKVYQNFINGLKKRKSALAPVEEFTEMFQRGEYNKFWYNDARQATADLVGVDIDARTQLPNNLLLLKFVAATSPRKAVEPNIELALDAFAKYKTHDFSSGMLPEWGDNLKFNEKNLDRIVTGEPFLYDAGGIKVADFYDALVGNPNAIVIDSHMMGAFGFATPVKDPKTGEESLKYFASPAQVKFMKSFIEQEAARWGVTPREYQAAVWTGRKFKIGLHQGEVDPMTFGNHFRKIAEQDPYFKYPPGITGEEGKTNFATMWMLSRLAAGLLFGGSIGDTPRERMSNAIVGAGLGLALPKLTRAMKTLVGIAQKSEAVIASEHAATRAETIFRLSGAGNDIKFTIGGKELGVNAARLQTPDGLAYAVEKVREARKKAGLDAAVLREGSRGVIPNDEARRLGRLLGLSQDDVLERLAGTPHAAEEVFAYTDILEGAWNHLVQMAHDVQVDPTSANKTAFRMFVPTYKSIGNQLLGTGEEAARALQAHGAKDVMTAKLKFKAAQGAVDLIEHAPNIPVEHLAKVITKIDAGEFARISKQADSLGWDIFNELLYFNLLSNPTTHAVNVLGSSVLAPGIALATRAGAAAMKYLRPRTPQSVILQDPLQADVTFGEVKSAIAGYFNGFAMAKRAVVDSWKGVEGNGWIEKFDNLRNVTVEAGGGTTKFDQAREAGISSKRLGMTPGLLAATTDGLGAMMRSTSTALKLGDMISQNINYSMEVYALAYRKAMAKGLKGKAFDAEYRRLIENPDKDVKEAAQQFAAVQTFTNALDGKLGSMQQFLSHPLTKLIAPFVGTPTNIFRYNLSYVPGLNFMLKSVREDIQAGGARADIVRAKMALGTAFIGSLAAFALDEDGPILITGNGPAEKSQRQVWLTDHQPNSIRIGGKNGQWFGLNRLDPAIGSFVSMTADFNQMLDEVPESTVSEWGVMAMMAFFKNMTSKTWSEPAFQFLDLLHIGRSETTENMMKALSDFAKSHAKLVVPVAGSQLAGVINQSFFDDTVKETADYMEAVQAQVPGWSKYLKPNLDYFGNVQHKNNLGPDLLSPINVKSGKLDPVVTEIRKERVTLPTIPKIIDGQPLTSDELYDFKKAFAKDVKVDGKNLHDYLTALITDKNSVYWQIPEDAGPNPLSLRSAFLKQQVKIFMDQAAEIMAEKYENPKFIALARQMKRLKAQGHPIDEAEVKQGLRERRREREQTVTIGQP